ncbi:hypothetical protein BC831DRAFT_212089 [Entophlyctis helioformis]|nr:hypothetical protein BC831DRAFT_212089 [Entophlyctis helioformis]
MRIVEAKRAGVSSVQIINGGSLVTGAATPAAPIPPIVRPTPLPTMQQQARQQPSQLLPPFTATTTTLPQAAAPVAAASLGFSFLAAGASNVAGSSESRQASQPSQTQLFGKMPSFGLPPSTSAQQTPLAVQSPATLPSFESQPRLFGIGSTAKQPMPAPQLSALSEATTATTAALPDLRSTMGSSALQTGKPADVRLPLKTSTASTLAGMPTFAPAPTLIAPVPPPPLSFSLPTQAAAPAPAAKPQPAPPPKPVSLAQGFESVKDDVLGGLIDQVSSTVASETLKGMQLMPKLIDGLSSDILAELLDSLISDTAFERLGIERDVAAFQAGIHGIYAELVESVIQEIGDDVVLEMVDDERRERRLMGLAWKQWRSLVLTRREERRQIAERARHFRANLAASALAPGFMRVSLAPAGLAGRDKAVGIASDTRMTEAAFQQQLLHIASKADAQKSSWLQPFDLRQTLLVPLLSRQDARSERHIHFKLVVSTPCAGDRAASGQIPWFTTRWLKTKFEAGNAKDDTSDSGSDSDSESSSDSGPPAEARVEVLAECNASLPAGTSGPGTPSVQAELLVQHYSCSATGSAFAEPQHNSEATLSGLNAAVFQVDYFKGDVPLDRYWSRQHARFCEFAGSMPHRSAVPLLVVFWPNDSLDAKTFETNAHRALGIDRHIHIGTLGPVHLLGLSASVTRFDHDTAASLLKASLASLVMESSLPPRLATNVLRDVVTAKLSPYIQLAANRVEEALRPHTRLYPAVYGPTFKMFAGIYNLFVTTVAGLITDDQLAAVPFPAQEFGGRHGLPLVSWNGPQTLQDLAHLAKTSLLSPSDPPYRLAEATRSNAFEYFASAAKQHIEQQYAQTTPLFKIRGLLDGIAAAQSLVAQLSSLQTEPSVSTDFPLSQTLLLVATAAFSPLATVLEETRPPYIPEAADQAVDSFVRQSRDLFHAWLAQLESIQVPPPQPPAKATAPPKQPMLARMSQAGQPAASPPPDNRKRQGSAIASTSPSR